jgi:hypothetical protein
VKSTIKSAKKEEEKDKKEKFCKIRISLPPRKK